MINNRQAGRRRGRGGGNNNNNSNGQRQGNPGRPDNGNRIDSRARGNASQLYEKYKSLASDAQRQGDRVNIEYYLQFADHYFRVLSEQRGRFEEQQPRRGRDEFDDDNDGEFGGGDFGDEGEPVRAGEQDAPRYDNRDDRPRADQRDGNRDERPRDSNRDSNRDGNRDDRPRAEQRPEQRPEQRDERPRESYRRDGGEVRNGRDAGESRDRDQGGQREWQERPRRNDSRPNEGRTGETRPVEIAGQRRADPIMANDVLEERAEQVIAADRPLDAPAQRRRGRPRREEQADTAGASLESTGFGADRLPPALTPTLGLAANDEAPADAKPRRRRRPAEDTPTAAE